MLLKTKITIISTITLLMGFGLNALCIGAAVLHQDIRIYWPGISAGAILPFMILYPFLQKYFVKGINIGAVKE